MANNNKHTGPNVPALRFPEFSGEWEQHSLSDYLRFKNGLNPDAKRFGKGIKFISVMDILNNASISYDCVRASVAATEQEISDFEVEYGDVLFQRSSETLEDIGRSNIYVDSRHCVFGGFVIRGKKIGEYEPYFMKYRLDSPYARKSIIVKGAGAQHFNIGQDGLSKVELFFPKYEEQVKIGDLLRIIDDRINTQSKIIEDKETLYKAIIDKHFKEIRKNDAIQEVYLSNVFKERVEYSSNDGVFPHASLTKEGVSIKTDRYNRDFLVKDTDKQYKVTRINDICYNPANLKFGVITRNKVGTLIFSPIYVTFEVRNGYDPAYIELMVTNSDFINKMLRFQEGTVYERMAVSSEDFLSESCKIPDLEIQTEFSAHVSKIEQSIQVEKKYLESIRRIKNYILEAMFI